MSNKSPNHLATVKRLQYKRRNRWMERIGKLQVGHQTVMHHLTAKESKLATLYFKYVGRVDRDPKRPSVTTLSRYINMTPWTVKRELRLRTELLFCRPMARGNHQRLHLYERWEGEKSI
jgi:hypothetical protein